MISSKKRALFYLTFNGIYNNNNGIGTQSKLLLEGVARYYKDFSSDYGKFSLNIITPIYNKKTTLDYSQDDLDYAREITESTGGEVFFCPYEYNTDLFWDVDSWRTMSIGAAAIVLEKTSKYTESLVIPVDPPFLHTPQVIERSKTEYKLDIKSLISMYSTSYLHDKGSLNSKRLAWEYNGFTSSKIYEDIYIGSVCNFFKQHVNTNYGIPLDRFAPYESSLLVDSEKFQKLKPTSLKATLNKYDIPTDTDIVFAFGRASWIKGFDILLEEIKFLKKRPHLVLIAVQTNRNHDVIKKYKKIIKKNNLACTLITKFCKDLPKALTQWKKTRAVICPSRGEPFSNIPLEVSLWAKYSEAVLLCSCVDGYTEQIIHKDNGFLFDINKPGDLATQLEEVLMLGHDDVKKASRQMGNEENDYGRAS